MIPGIRRQLKKHSDLKEAFCRDITQSMIAYQQERHRKTKLYNWHAPEVECISKGKADKPYEFGSKAFITTSINRAQGSHFALHASALHGRPYDGHTLN